jgi:hypothetical protein
VGMGLRVVAAGSPLGVDLAPKVEVRDCRRGIRLGTGPPPGLLFKDAKSTVNSELSVYGTSGFRLDYISLNCVIKLKKNLQRRLRSQKSAEM